MRISDWSSDVCSSDLAGRVYIDWGPGTRAWVQRAQEKPKPILEVTRIFQEEAFPGYTALIANLSAIEALPSNWLAALRAARGRREERRVGKEGVSTCRSRWSPDTQKKK